MAEFLQYDWNTVTLPSSSSSYNDLRRRSRKPDLIMARSLLKDLIDCCSDYEVKQFCHQELAEKNLLKFLHVSKLNSDVAFELIKNWLVYRNKHPEIFQKNFRVSNPLILKALKDGFPMVLENCDRKGRAVLILNARNWNSCYSLITIYQSLILSIEQLTNDTKYLLNGLVIIVDWTGFTLRQCKQLNPMLLKIMLDGLQNFFPAKFKGVHFIEQPWFVEMSLMVIKPFLNEKTSNRLFVHGNNLSTLHDYLPKDILPTELGGDIPSINTDIWIQKILDGAMMSNARNCTNVLFGECPMMNRHNSVEIIELKSNRGLLNANFDGYKLSVEPLETSSFRLPFTPHNGESTESTSLSLTYYRLRAAQNQLFYNHFEQYFCYIDEQFRIWKWDENCDSGFVTLWQIPKPAAETAKIQFPFNPAIFFIESLILVTNGLSDFFILNEKWELEYSCLKMLDDNFIISDVKLIDKDKLNIFLLNFDPTKNSISVIHVLKMTKVLKWEMIDKKILRNDGFIYYGRFSADCSAIFVISDGNDGFIFENGLPTREQTQWQQTEDEIRIKIFLKELTNKNFLKLKVNQNYIDVTYKETNVLRGTLLHPIQNGSATWKSSLQERSVEIELLKRSEKTLWESLFIDVEDNLKVQHVQYFTPDESSQIYCGVDSEECDISDNHCLHFDRYSLTEDRVTHKCNIGSRAFLFSTNRSEFALRHDVDALIWKPIETNDRFDLEHIDTLLAYGFVQASKTDKRFQNCAPDFSYSVITNSYSHLFIYLHSVKLMNSELRNRFTGKKYPNKAEQRVVHLPGSNVEIVGMYCANQYLYILTKSSFYIFKME